MSFTLYFSVAFFFFFFLGWLVAGVKMFWERGSLYIYSRIWANNKDRVALDQITQVNNYSMNVAAILSCRNLEPWNSSWQLMFNYTSSQNLTSHKMRSLVPICWDILDNISSVVRYSCRALKRKADFNTSENGIKSYFILDTSKSSVVLSTTTNFCKWATFYWSTTKSRSRILERDSTK